MTTYFITSGCKPRSLVTLLFTLLISLLTIASANADPTGRVGRLSWLSGAVTLQSPDSDDSAAMLNWPLTTGHRLITGPDARAEVQIGSTMLQIASRSVVEFLQVDDERVRLYLLDGSLTARLYVPEAVHEFEIVTREGGFQPLTAGFFRVDVDRSSSAATAYSGRLRFMAADQTVMVETGQRAQLWHDGRTQHRFLLPDNDEFARWATVRDQQYGSPLQARYVSAEMTGASHLDTYGRWYDSPEYGAVWFPQTVAADWAPYRDGHWAWISPWGWTWIGVEAWGFAPFHYGRWVFYRNAWGWVPGQRVHRPVYAPALVAWMGTPGNITVPIGWFPLAPREIYRPAYQSSERYLRALNGPHAPQNFNYRAFLANSPAAAPVRYEYHGQPRAVTMVPANTFGHRRPVNETIIAERDRRQWATQPVQFQAPVAAPRLERRDSERHEYDRPLEAERRTVEERRPEIDRRRNVERASEQSSARPRENNAFPSSGSGQESRPERPADATSAARFTERSDRQAATSGMQPGTAQPSTSGTAPSLPAARSTAERPLPDAGRPAPTPRAEPVRPPVVGGVVERPLPEAGRPAHQPRSEAVRPPVSSVVVDRPAPEATRVTPMPRPERVEQRPAFVAPAPVPQRTERPAVEVRSVERAARRNDPPGRPEMGLERPQPPRQVPATQAPVSVPMPAERIVRPEAEVRGSRERRDERRSPGNPERP